MNYKTISIVFFLFFGSGSLFLFISFTSAREVRLISSLWQEDISQIAFTSYTVYYMLQGICIYYRCPAITISTSDPVKQYCLNPILTSNNLNIFSQGTWAAQSS